jgi:hypothetical protein
MHEESQSLIEDIRGELLTKDKAVREACDLASYLLTRVRESELLNK